LQRDTIAAWSKPKRYLQRNTTWYGLNVERSAQKRLGNWEIRCELESPKFET
jgi:hypothetical protein